MFGAVRGLEIGQRDSTDISAAVATLMQYIQHLRQTPTPDANRQRAHTSQESRMYNTRDGV